MAQKFQITIRKNGETITEDDDGDLMEVIKGTKLLEAMDTFGYSADGYEKIMVNGDLKEVKQLQTYEITDDVKVEFVNKSSGGIIAFIRSFLKI